MSGAAMSRVLAPIHRRIRSMISRCVLDAVDADTLRQTLQVKLLAGEIAAGVEHFEPYAFTSHPLDGDGLFFAIGSNRSHGAVVNIGGRTYRPTGLEPGESQQYDHQGQYIWIKRDGTIEINANAQIHAVAPDVLADCDTATVNASSQVTLNTPQTHITGDAVIDGQLNVGGNIVGAQQIIDAIGSMQAIRGVYNSHTHPENDSGGPTDPPNQEMG